MNELKNLEKISHEIGVNSALVQGGGGNTSVKMDGGRMAIKASGFTLKDLTETRGYSIVDVKPIIEGIKNPATTQDSFTETVRASVVATQNRPSIETGFHCILKKYVIHSHSVFSNVLCCSREGKDIAKKIFPNAAWIPYGAPGLDIVRKISSVHAGHSVILLQNHGLITTSDEMEDALNLHALVDTAIRAKLNMKDYQSHDDTNFEKGRYLFPDQVVCDSQENKYRMDIFKAANFILQMIQNNGLHPVFLQESYITEINNMEAERFRQGKMQ